MLDTNAKEGVFSCFLLDREKNNKDHDDLNRILRKAAEADAFSGEVYYSDVDLESGNFSATELKRILWSWAEDLGVDLERKDELEKLIDDAMNPPEGASKKFKDMAPGRRLFKSIEDAYFPNAMGKGEEWGRRLARFAVENPRPDRPLFEALRGIQELVGSNFLTTSQEKRVNKDTLRLEVRPPEEDQG